MNMKKYTRHYSALLRLGFPIMVGQLGAIIMGFADTLMIGHHSTRELAAAGFVNNIVGMMVISAVGFSYGLTPVVGALLGEGRLSLMAGKLRSSILANSLMALLFMSILTVLYFCLSHIGLEPELLPVARPYFLVLIVSLLPLMVFNAFKQFSDGVRNTAIPMCLLLGGNAVNIVGNWLLIYGKWGFPEMGLLGAGISTLFSRVLMCVVFYVLFLRSSRYRDYSRDYASSRITRSDLRQMFRLGIPLTLQMGMETASFSLSVFYVGWLGTMALAAHQVMITVSQLCFMLYYGLSSAVAVQISYYRGRGRHELIPGIAVSGLHLTWLLGAVLSIPIFICRDSLGGLFTEDTEVVGQVAALIPIFCVYQFGDSLQCIYANSLRGVEDVRPMMWIAFVAYMLVSLPSGYFFCFVMDYGLPGVWMAFPFGLTTAGLLYMQRFRHTVRRMSGLAA